MGSKDLTPAQQRQLIAEALICDGEADQTPEGKLIMDHIEWWGDSQYPAWESLAN